MLYHANQAVEFTYFTIMADFTVTGVSPEYDVLTGHPGQV